MPEGGQRRLALALGGGAGWCIAHIGVLQALEDAGIRIDAVAGTSGGSVIGALYADGKSPAELEGIAANASRFDFISPTVPVTGLFNSRAVGDFMEDHLAAAEFKDLRMPFAAVAAEIESGEKVTITDGPIAVAVRASCSIPVVYTPTKMNGRTLVDGGLVSAVPVDSARDELGADIVVGINVMHRENHRPNLMTIPHIATHMAMLVFMANIEQERPRADVFIDVPVDGIALHDVGRYKELIERGREAADKSIGLVKQKLAGG